MVGNPESKKCERVEEWQDSRSGSEQEHKDETNKQKGHWVDYEKSKIVF